MKYWIILPVLFLSVKLTAFGQEKPAKKKDIWFEDLSREGVIKVWAKNSSYAPRTLRIRFSKLDNLRATREVPATIIIPPRVEKHWLLDLNVIDRSKKWTYRNTWDYTIGDAFTAHHDEKHLYLLPYQHGEKYHVSQEFYGTISHNNPGSFFAVDFDMPMGTKLCAARAGKVVFAREDSSTGGPDPSFKEQGNSVIILHKDGTFAEYSHIQKDGVLVELGDTVKAGQVIALCGDTGWSTGPHLDFCVRMPQGNGKNRTIPIRFRGKDNTPLRAKKGIYYYSYHPGKKPFKTIFGRDITNQTYGNHKAKLPNQGNKMKLRVVKIDEAFVMYLQNFDNKPKQATFTLKKSKNIESSYQLPHSMKIGPLEERYFLFLRKEIPTGAWSYDYDLKWKGL